MSGLMDAPAARAVAAMSGARRGVGGPRIKGTSAGGGACGREMAPVFGICEHQKFRFVSV